MDKIILIEDDDHLSQILVKNLTSNGYKVNRAYEGEQALWMLTKEKYDLIILDLGLPGINGINVLAKIKGKEETKNIPAIVLTNKDNNEDFSKAQQLGVDKFLIKANYSLSDILKIIKTFLDTK